MNIGLIGYGKMGHAIEELAESRGHKVTVRLRSSSTETEWEALREVEVAIDFTQPEGAVERFRWCFENGVKLVTGTTGWYDEMKKVQNLCTNAGASFFWASNFSIGVHLFWKTNKKLAALMAGHSDYRVSMREVHHTQKLDEPSGTAITTANHILEHYPGLRGWALSSAQPGPDQLSINAVRDGDVKGVHVVRYESDIDFIELKHEAKNRKGFATGAVLAAEYLSSRKGFHAMEDLLDAL